MRFLFLFLFLLLFGSFSFAQENPSSQVSSGIVKAIGPDGELTLEVSKQELSPGEFVDRLSSASVAGAKIIVTTENSTIYSQAEKINKNNLMLFLSKASDKIKEKFIEPIKQDKTQFTILTMITSYEIYVWFTDSAINQKAAWGQTFLSLIWYFSFGLEKQNWVNLRSSVANYVFTKASGVLTSKNFKNYLNFLTNLGLVATWMSFRMGVFSATGNSDFFMGKGDFTSLQILAKAGLISGLVAIAHSLSNVFLDNWYQYVKSKLDVKIKSSEPLSDFDKNLKRSVDRIIEFKTLHLGLVLTASGLVNPDIHGYSAWSWTVAYAFAGSLIYYYRDHLNNILTYTLSEKLIRTISQIKARSFGAGSVRCSALFN